MHHVRKFELLITILGVVAFYTSAPAAEKVRIAAQEYVPEPMPPGFQVVSSELEGPVFGDAKGLTLYRWPRHGMRNGNAGEQPGDTSHCGNIPAVKTVGNTSPFPGELELPDLEHRPTCVQHWPPVLAAADAKPIGNWTIIERDDGTKQWAYQGYPLYRSHLDGSPGETNGGSLREGWDSTSEGAPRVPAVPMPHVPTQFEVAAMFQGRMLTTDKHFSVYAFDGDTPKKSNCNDRCLDEWIPIAAPEAVLERGPWGSIHRSNGARQWTYRGMPLYTHVFDTKVESYEGSDVPGWHNVFMQRTPAPPTRFKLVDTRAGQVLADSNGKTIYFYSCVEDTPDTLYCDSPDTPQEYRLAMCGAGDPKRCLQMFPYVIAGASEKSTSLSWSIIQIDPMTGRLATAGTPGVLRVWAYRGRPLYTFSRDVEPGDIGADDWGQDHGQRNGFRAFWWRDDFRNLDGSRDYRPV